MGGCVTTSNKNTKSVAPLPGPSLDIPFDRISSNHSVYPLSSVGTPSFPTPILISPTPTPQITNIPVYNRLLPDENVMSFTTYAQHKPFQIQQNRILQPIIAESYENLPIPSLNQLPSIIKRGPQITQQLPMISQFNQQVPVSNVVQQVITKDALNHYNQPIQNNISQFQSNIIHQRPISPYSNSLTQYQIPYIPIQKVVIQKPLQNQPQLIDLNNQAIKNSLPKFSIPPPSQNNIQNFDFDKNLLNMNLSRVSNPSPQLYTFSYGMKMPIMGEQYQKSKAL